jgi:hypothetical protein
MSHHPFRLLNTDNVFSSLNEVGIVPTGREGELIAKRRTYERDRARYSNDVQRTKQTYQTAKAAYAKATKALQDYDERNASLAIDLASTADATTTGTRPATTPQQGAPR